MRITLQLVQIQEEYKLISTLHTTTQTLFFYIYLKALRML